MRQLDLGAGDPPPILIVESKDWLPGILGLIASHLSESYYRPAVAVLVGQEVSRASMRSIPEFDVVEALQRSHELFHRYGGHPRAAGFTISTSDLTTLKADLMLAAQEKLGNKQLRPSIDIDFETSPSVFDDANLEFIQSLAPFGEGNRSPVFLTRGLHVAKARKVGQQSNHLKMTVVHEGRAWEAIAFNLGDRPVSVGGRVDLVYNVGFNHWGGVTTIQLGVLDLRVAR
jgi:single-stranded-DNA-specific exonuclease